MEPKKISKSVNDDIKRVVKILKEYTIEEVTEKGTKQLEEEIELEIEEKEKILGKNATVTETEQYLEITVTYEVIENIGMQEKIKPQEQQIEQPAYQ